MTSGRVGACGCGCYRLDRTQLGWIVTALPPQDPSSCEDKAPGAETRSRDPVDDCLRNARVSELNFKFFLLVPPPPPITPARDNGPRQRHHAQPLPPANQAARAQGQGVPCLRRTARDRRRKSGDVECRGDGGAGEVDKDGGGSIGA